MFTRALSVFILLACLAAPQVLSAAGGLDGWEADSDYQKLVNTQEFDQFDATINRIIQVTPKDGMAEGMGFLITMRGDSEEITAHFGPAAFVKPRIRELRPGMMVKVYGFWADLDGEEIFILTKAKIDKDGDARQIKVRRTKDGYPWWSLTPEELAKEETANEL